MQIAQLLAVADGIRKNTSESERREAITQLLSEFRSQHEQAVREMEDHQKARAAVIGTAEAAMTTAAQSTTDEITAEFDALRLVPPFDPLLMQSVKVCAYRLFLQAAMITGAQTTAELDALGPGPRYRSFTCARRESLGVSDFSRARPDFGSRKILGNPASPGKARQECGERF
jgi:hypothetical protein